MTRKDIIRMAREIGVPFWPTDVHVTIDELQRFAALVAAHERETCAKVVEQCPWPKWAEGIDTRELFAAAIRKRVE